jgi:phage terminase large subunit-like protein
MKYDPFASRLILTPKQDRKSSEYQSEFALMMKKRSRAAIESSVDFIKFREYVCGHKTYDHMMVWHHELNTGMDNKYLRGIAGEDTCILSPRNSSKSTFLLQWVAWVIGVHVNYGISLKILYISYALDAATGKSRQIKAIIQSDRYQEVFPLVKKSKSKWGENEWAIDFDFAGLRTIDETYTLACSGLTGAINSRRSHLCVIDDPQKSPSEAKNKSIQDRMTENYRNVVEFTRYDGSRFITLGTLMAKFDAYSRIFVAPYYRVITQSALVEEVQPDGSIIEKSFWEPESENSPGIRLSTLIEERSKDEESFLLQRQNQIPAEVSEGISAKNIKHGWMPPKFDRIVIGADTADSTDEHANNTAFVVIGIHQDSLYVLNAWEGKIQGSLRKIDTIYDLWESHKDFCKYPAILAVDWHSHTIGLEGDIKSYLNDLQEDLSLDQTFRNISIEKVKSSGRGSKIDRMTSHSYLFEKGRIVFNLISPKNTSGKELIPVLVDQIVNHNPLDHNDLMDAMEVAIYTARQYIKDAISVIP